MIYTLGHSNHAITGFMELLGRYGITAVVDVRSHPYSRRLPQYSREALRATLSEHGIGYIFLGRELGARSNNPACYKDGKIQYGRLAQELAFSEGIQRVIDTMQDHLTVLLCAEKDPIQCHRALLVARKLFEMGVPVSHILADGTLEYHEAFESRLLALCKLPEGDMFKTRAEFIADAFAVQGDRVAYRDESLVRCRSKT